VADDVPDLLVHALRQLAQGLGDPQRRTLQALPRRVLAEVGEELANALLYWDVSGP
jgi:hypothetical protein